MFNLIRYIWCCPHLFLCVMQLEEAFADKPGYEGVQLIGVRYGNSWGLNDCQLFLLPNI